MNKRRMAQLLFFIVFLIGFYIGGTLLLPVFRAIGMPVPMDAAFSDMPTWKSEITLAQTVLPLTEVAAPPHTDVPAVPQPQPSEDTEQTEYGVYPTEAAASGKEIKNSTDYAVDVEASLATPLVFSTAQPKVLIVHTHTSEAYAQSEAFSYTPSDPYRTEDVQRNITRVGAELAWVLESQGIGTVQDTTSHDYPSYSGCYNRSLETIQKNLQAYPSVQIVLDLHRDAIADSAGDYLKTVATIDGVTCAQALVVVGTDFGGLQHDNWRTNLALGLKLQNKLCTMYPGLARPLHLRTERFNGHVSPGALLLEIGSNGNTMEEALACARLVGNALAALIADCSG